MAEPYTPLSSFVATITVPNDLDPADAESVALPLRQVADRTENLKAITAKLDEINSLSKTLFLQQTAADQALVTSTRLASDDTTVTGNAWKLIFRFAITPSSHVSLYVGGNYDKGVFAVTVNATWTPSTQRWTLEDTTRAAAALFYGTSSTVKSTLDLTVSYQPANSGAWQTWPSGAGYLRAGRVYAPATVLDSTDPLDPLVSSTQRPSTTAWKQLMRFPLLADNHYLYVYSGGDGPKGVFAITINAVWKPSTAKWGLGDSARAAGALIYKSPDGAAGLDLNTAYVAPSTADWLDWPVGGYFRTGTLFGNEAKVSTAYADNLRTLDGTDAVRVAQSLKLGSVDGVGEALYNSVRRRKTQLNLRTAIIRGGGFWGTKDSPNTRFNYTNAGDLAYGQIMTAPTGGSTNPSENYCEVMIPVNLPHGADLRYFEITLTTFYLLTQPSRSVWFSFFRFAGSNAHATRENSVERTDGIAGAMVPYYVKADQSPIRIDNEAESYMLFVELRYGASLQGVRVIWDDPGPRNF